MTRPGGGRPCGRSPFRPPARRPLLARLVPVSEGLRGYGGGTLRRDLLAGVTVAALALPAAMAYGELVGRDHLYPAVRSAVQAAAVSGPGSPPAGDGRPPSETRP